MELLRDPAVILRQLGGKDEEVWFHPRLKEVTNQVAALVRPEAGKNEFYAQSARKGLEGSSSSRFVCSCTFIALISGGRLTKSPSMPLNIITLLRLIEISGLMVTVVVFELFKV